MEKSGLSIQKQHQSEGVDTRGGLGEECKHESSQFLLFEPRVEGEELTESSEEIAGAKGVDAIL